MSTKNELIFSILDTVRPENMTNSDITTELVGFHIKNVRAQLIKQSLNKGYTPPNSCIQSLGCITVSLADKSDCCEYPTGCVILKTNVQIPQVIDYSTNLLTRVGPVDITERPYQNIEFERVPFEGYNKYTKNLIKWFIPNNSNYLYLLINADNYLKLGLEVINVQGVFENPDDVSSFTNCSTGTTCFSSDSKYPVPDSMIPIIQEMVIKKFILPQSQAPIDSSNNAKTDPQTTITKGN